MGMSRSKERLLKRRRGLIAAHNSQEKPAAELDAGDRQEQNTRGASSVS
jgi:hypothetical protein